jgi:hypothetical protein
MDNDYIRRQVSGLAALVEVTEPCVVCGAKPLDTPFNLGAVMPCGATVCEDCVRVALLHTPTPWGEAIHASTWAPGIVFYETGRHGGVKLDAARNAEMPDALRRVDGWYEEDCEAAKVLAVFGAEIEDVSEDVVEQAKATVRQWFPSQYRAWERGERSE